MIRLLSWLKQIQGPIYGSKAEFRCKEAAQGSDAADDEIVMSQLSVWASKHQLTDVDDLDDAPGLHKVRETQRRPTLQLKDPSEEIRELHSALLEDEEPSHLGAVACMSARAVLQEALWGRAFARLKLQMTVASMIDAKDAFVVSS